MMEDQRLRHLILIRHAAPGIDRTRPASGWPLSDDGRAACSPLADEIAPYRPTVIVSSHEAKAVETATLVATRLGIVPTTANGLHEHERRNVPWLDGALWTETVAEFFAHPDNLIFGQETARQARDRFTSAVLSVLELYPTYTVVIVAHGTVMSLFVAAQAGEAFDLWQRLGMPSFVVLTLPELAVERIVAKMPVVETVSGSEEGEPG